MRLLSPPACSQIDMFDACVQSVSDDSYRDRLNRLRPSIGEISRDYINLATSGRLFTLTPASHGNPDQIIQLGLSKKDLVTLYETHMVKKPFGRKYYDEILSSAPLSKCVYCGFGQVSTLDHFASKSRYPIHAIEGRNLIPSCADCNKLLGSAPIHENSQLPHPYFEDERIESDLWLFASVLETSPATVDYIVSPPTSWDHEFAARVRNYFKDLELSRRFSIEGNSAIIEVSDSLRLIEVPQDRVTHLRSIARAERDRRKNSWRAALCEALAGSDWYVRTGFLG